MTAEEILKKCPTLGKITIDEMNMFSQIINHLILLDYLEK
jgi:hypothetical protein